MREYRILHLEDSHSDADVVKRVLLKENLNFQYFLADDKESFIHGLTDFKPNVILCDHALPQFNSIMAFDIQKQMKFEIPFILVTGTVSEEYAVEMLKKGIDDYLLKTNLQRLPQAIKSAFDKRKNEKGIKEGIKKLENSESRMKEAQKIAHLGNWELDFETRIGIWSDEACRIYGLSPEDNEQTFENWISFIHPDDLEYVMKTVNEAQKTLVDSKMNHRIVLKDGTIKHVTSESKINIDSTGKPIGIYGIVHDITERKKKEELLRQSEMNLLAIFENTETGFLLLDTLFNIISFNNQINHFAKISFGFELQEKQNLISLLLPEKQKEFAGMFSAVIKGNNINNEISYHLTDGSIIWYHLSGNCVLDTNGKAVGICLAINDITEKKESEQKLEQQNKELVFQNEEKEKKATELISANKELVVAQHIREKLLTDLSHRNNELMQFNYVVSHNLRAPLATIIGLSHLFDLEVTEKEKEDTIRFIQTTALRMDEVIRDLTEILESKNTINEKKGLINLEKIIYAIHETLMMQINNSKTTINIFIAPDVNCFMSIKAYIESILYNLINNAIKYRSPKRHAIIIIEAVKKENEIIIKVTDNGIGINLELNKDRVFGLYSRFHSESEGKGLGLYMTKLQVESLGGHIEIISVPDEGSTFTITFKIN